MLGALDEDPHLKNSGESFIRSNLNPDKDPNQDSAQLDILSKKISEHQKKSKKSSIFESKYLKKMVQLLTGGCELDHIIQKWQNSPQIYSPKAKETKHKLKEITFGEKNSERGRDQNDRQQADIKKIADLKEEKHFSPLLKQKPKNDLGFLDSPVLKKRDFCEDLVELDEIEPPVVKKIKNNQEKPIDSTLDRSGDKILKFGGLSPEQEPILLSDEKFMCESSPNQLDEFGKRGYDLFDADDREELCFGNL